MKFTNKTKGPKSVNTTTGPVILAPGESADLTVSKEEVAAMDRLGFLDPSTAENQSSVPDPDAAARAATIQQMVDGNSEADLRKIAEDEDVDLAEAKNKTDIATAIVAKREANAA